MRQILPLRVCDVLSPSLSQNPREGDYGVDDSSSVISQLHTLRQAALRITKVILHKGFLIKVTPTTTTSTYISQVSPCPSLHDRKNKQLQISQQQLEGAEEDSAPTDCAVAALGWIADIAGKER